MHKRRIYIIQEMTHILPSAEEILLQHFIPFVEGTYQSNSIVDLSAFMMERVQSEVKFL